MRCSTVLIPVTMMWACSSPTTFYERTFGYDVDAPFICNEHVVVSEEERPQPLPMSESEARAKLESLELADAFTWRSHPAGTVDRSTTIWSLDWVDAPATEVVNIEHDSWIEDKLYSNTASCPAGPAWNFPVGIAVELDGGQAVVAFSGAVQVYGDGVYDVRFAARTADSTVLSPDWLQASEAEEGWSGSHEAGLNGLISDPSFSIRTVGASQSATTWDSEHTLNYPTLYDEDAM